MTNNTCIETGVPALNPASRRRSRENHQKKLLTASSADVINPAKNYHILG
jgi:hypothetical protein